MKKKIIDNKQFLSGLLVLFLFAAVLNLNGKLYDRYEVYPVKAVIDGDTILLENGAQVRYIGMDTPEIGQPYALEAAERNSELIAANDNKVKLEFDSLLKDRYNRLLAYVYVDRGMINQILLKEGLAKTLAIKPDVKYQYLFARAQAQAKVLKKGMWRDER